MISGIQIRMARAALKWGVRELAEKANVTPNTVSRFENGSSPNMATVKAISEVLEGAGVIFIDDGAQSLEGGFGIRLAGD